MTRIEECFPPDIVRAVYDRLKNEAKQTQEPIIRAVSNVVSLTAYRQRVMNEGRKVVL
ncbi:hypothetical protein [Sinorhizobium meliloti]|uniref:hypothetical protein n=1 Tax=Rhizobium meliloti TaxID=382 RepID=UPI0013E35DB2|nr:hypothetical protein [Sinorhizobium meliloti]